MSASLTPSQRPPSSPVHVVVVTGMSGAGRSTALNVLEDLGFFCVDNLPPALAPALLARIVTGEEIARVGLGVDVRTRGFLEGAAEVFEALEEAGHEVEVLFLDSADNVLVRRFSETRRPHPLSPGGDVLTGIQLERQRLGALRARAGHVIDTTELSVHDLRRALVDWVARGGGRPRMVTRVVSFGFKCPWTPIWSSTCATSRTRTSCRSFVRSWARTLRFATSCWPSTRRRRCSMISSAC